MIAVSKTVYINKPLETVDKYSKTYTTIRKPSDVQTGTYIDYGVDHNKEDPNFKVVNHVRLSKYKSILPKGTTPYQSEEAFGIKNVKNTVLWTYIISDLDDEGIVITL